jgi:Haem-degrading
LPDHGRGKRPVEDRKVAVIRGREGHRDDRRRDLPSEGLSCFRYVGKSRWRHHRTTARRWRGSHTVENSRRKAYTANTFRTDTAAYAKRLNDGDPVVRQQVTLPGVIAIGGGLPIKAADEVIGGAAISGSPGGNDEVCVQAGLDKAKDLLR